MPLARATPVAIVAALAAFLEVAGEGQALASGTRPSARLDFRTDANVSGCKDAAAFRARVATRLGYDPFVDDASMLVRVRFVARATRVVARIDIEDAGKPAGSRQLEEASSRCEPLSEAAAAAVAMAIDPVGRPPAAPEPAAPENNLPAHEDAPPPAVSADRAAPPAPAPAPSTRIALTLDGVGALGLAPGPTLGAQAGVGARHGSFVAAVEGRIDASPSAVRVSDTDRVTATAYSAALVPCALVDPFTLCLGARFGSLETIGVDVPSPSSRGSLLATALGRVLGRLPLTRDFALRLGAEVALPFVRTTLSIDGRPAWTAPALHGSLLLGVVWSPP